MRDHFWLQSGICTARLRVAIEARAAMANNGRSKHQRPDSESPTEKDAKQQRPYESPCDSPQKMGDAGEAAQPSLREIAAAEAARARLYGSAEAEASKEEAKGKLPDGEPPAVVDVEYVPTELLQPLEDPQRQAKVALQEMQSKEWTVACSGLLLMRRLVVCHTEQARPLLSKVVPLVLNSVKSLRSSLCKTAIMTTADLFSTFGDAMLPFLDIGGAARPLNSLLSQLLLKASSNDKRFVIEETQRALQVMADTISPQPLLGKLLAYASHKNPKVRGKVATAIAASTQRMEHKDWLQFGTEAMLKTAGRLVSDNTPDARNAARQLIPVLHSVFEKQAEEKENEGQQNVPLNSPRDVTKRSQKDGAAADEEVRPSGWEAYCRQTLGNTVATTVLKVA